MILFNLPFAQLLHKNSSKQQSEKNNYALIFLSIKVLPYVQKHEWMEGGQIISYFLAANKFRQNL
jgi:hypothetical protein